MRGRGGELRVERIADDGRALDQRPRDVAQRPDLMLHGDDQRRGQRVLATVGDARELAQEERVAAAFHDHALAHGGIGDVGDHRVRVVAVERSEGELLPARGAAGRVEQPGGGADRAARDHEQRGHGHRTARQVQHELDRRVVGPVQVVEQERDRRQALERGGDLAMAAEALRHRHRARRARQLAERVAHHPEGDVALVLDAASRDDP